MAADAPSIRREAVEQPGAAGRHQRWLAAALGGMRRVPGHRRRRLVEALAVVMADDGRAGIGAGPVVAGRVLFTAADRAAVGRRAGEDVVRVRLVAAAVDHLAGFGEGGLLVEVVLVAVQVVERAGDHFALRVLPRAAADTVARIDRFRTGGAEVGAPGLGGGAGSGR